MLCYRESDPVMLPESAFYVTNQPSSGYWPIIPEVENRIAAI
jgi:hypothetical protein